MLTISAEHFDKRYGANALKNYRYIGQQEIGKKNSYLHWQIFISNPSRKGAIKFETLRKAFPVTEGGSVRIDPYNSNSSTNIRYNWTSDTKPMGGVHRSNLHLKLLP